jgi:hypothetical protein
MDKSQVATTSQYDEKSSESQLRDLAVSEYVKSYQTQ